MHLHDDAVNASALANVLMILADNKVSLITIRSVGQQTEQAFLDLVEKEESRGFAGCIRWMKLHNGRLWLSIRAEPQAARITHMDAPAATAPVKINRWLPYWAVFQADVRQTLQSWVYRTWVLVSVLVTVGYSLYRYGAEHEGAILQSASQLVSDLLRWTSWAALRLSLP